MGISGPLWSNHHEIVQVVYEGARDASRVDIVSENEVDGSRGGVETVVYRYGYHPGRRAVGAEKGATDRVAA